ncbi:spore gernimation protein [Bacillus australimaris]|uniref:Ger(X)C family spore germination protein n=1 Tax=Bacillus australimaris TaxID=1326968 RepID=A0ABD4QLQ5_9BACI|nr:Ger(x)C family spore germination protein [Bacillus australimaris]KPN14540.1 spore gernimation protein [Bacillus australimaris]MBR8689692.1 Ger(x)C family spore germination protein [Bacillus australimaris]
MKKKAAFALLALALLSGCWDSTNIEELNMAIGYGLDKGDDGHKLKISMQVLVPQKIEQESSVKDPTKIIETNGDSVHQIFRTTTLKSHRIFAQQLRVYLFSEELINENNFDLVINQFIRDNETRRGSLVFMTAEKPGDLLKINDDGQPASSTLYDISGNTKSTIRMLKPVSLGDISSAMQNNVSFAVPKVSVDQGKLILDGASIIKNKRFLTDISPLAVQSYNLLTGEGKGGVIEFEYDHSIYSYEIFKLKHNIETKKTASGRYQFDVSVKLDGRLSEDWNERENAFNEKYLQEIEGAVERQLKKTVNDFIGELQHEIKADICGFSQKASIAYPKDFRKEAKHWDEIFSESDIRYKVNVKIRDFGTKGATQSL